MERSIFKHIAMKAAFAVLLIASPASALVVSDPGAYARMAEALKNAQAQLEKMSQQVQELTKAKETLGKITGQLEGNYNRAVGLYSEIKQISKQLEKGKPSFGDGKYGKDYKELDVYIDEIFVDPRDKEYNAWLLSKAKYETRQNVYKESMKKSEVELREMDKRMQKIASLGDAINQTQNTKDAQDLSNRLLTELLIGQERLIGIVAQLAQAYAIANYKGVTKKDGRQSAGSSKETALDRMAREAGAHEGMTTDELMHMMNLD